MSAFIATLEDNALSHLKNTPSLFFKMVKTRGKRLHDSEDESEGEEMGHSSSASERQLDEPSQETETDSETEQQRESASLTEIPKDTATAESVATLPLDRAAKDFYQLLFSDHEITTLKGPAGRSIRKYGAQCNKCERRVTSTDSFFGFRSHYLTKHAEDLAPAENEFPKKRFRDPTEAVQTAEMVPMEIPPAEPVDNLPWDHSGKEFFQRLFRNHLLGKEQRKADGRTGTRYSAECKLCGKHLMGLDGFFKFREHYKLRHPTGRVGNLSGETEDRAESRVDGQHSENVADSQPSSNPDRPAKEYFKAYFTAHATTKEEEPKAGCRRGCIRYSADCKLCGKKIQGTDSFFGFRTHIKHKHRDLSEQSFADLAEFVTFPTTTGNVVEVPSTESDVEGGVAETVGRDTSARNVYQTHFVEHSTTAATSFSGKERKKMRAVCRRCGKVVQGNSSYHAFKTHITLCQNATSVGLTTAGVPTPHAAVRSVFKVRHAASDATTLYHGQQLLNKNVALCAAEILMPFDSVTSRCFDRLVKGIDGHLVWPNSASLTGKHLPELRAFIRDSITRDLLTVPAVAVTVNVWAVQPQGYFTVVVHYVDDQWRIRNPVIAFKRFTPHTAGKTLSDAILGVLKEFSVTDQVVHVDVNDLTAVSAGAPSLENGDDSTADGVLGKFSGVRMGKMVREVKKCLLNGLEVVEYKVQMRNVVRILEIILEESVKESAEVSAVLKKISGTPTVWKKSRTGTATSGDSAWTAVLQKVKSATETESSTRAKTVSALKLTDADKSLLTDFLKIADGFEDFFMKLRQQDAPTVCDLIPFVYGLRQHLTNCAKDAVCLKEFAASLLHLLGKEFEGVDEEELYVLAAFIHPNYKLGWCKASPSPQKRETVRNLILQKMNELNAEEEGGGDRQELLEERPLQQKRRPALLSFMADLPVAGSARVGSGRADELGGEAELSAYLEEELVDENPLLYWKRSKERFKRLSRLAESVLFVPTVPVKMRLFQDCLGADRPAGQFGAHWESVLFCHVNPEFAENFTGHPPL